MEEINQASKRNVLNKKQRKRLEERGRNSSMLAVKLETKVINEEEKYRALKIEYDTRLQDIEGLVAEVVKLESEREVRKTEYDSIKLNWLRMRSERKSLEKQYFQGVLGANESKVIANS